jgi:hypothetical protein
LAASWSGPADAGGHKRKPKTAATPTTESGFRFIIDPPEAASKPCPEILRFIQDDPPRAPPLVILDPSTKPVLSEAEGLTIDSVKNLPSTSAES